MSSSRRPDNLVNVLTTLASAVLLVVAVTACSDDSDSSDVGSDSDAADIEVGSPDVPESDVEEETGDDGPGTDMCIEEADRSIIEADVDDVNEKGIDCALDCLGQPDVFGCSRDCVAEETGLSEGCAGCYAWMVMCSIEHCVAECVDDAASELCRSCQREHCDATFDACTGVTE